MALKLDISKAGGELSQKSLDDIQVETAKTWGARAAIAYVWAKKELHNEAKWLSDAKEYLHEALEHAALSDDDDLVHQIRESVRIFMK